MTATLDTPLYNSRIFDSYLKLIRKRYSHVDITTLLRHADMSESEVADFGHWFSQRQVDLFYDKLVHLTGNPAIAREAGRYAASSDSLGALRNFLLGLIGPEHVFAIINRVAANFTRSSRCTSRKLGPRKLELTVHYEEGVRESSFQCENRIGYFEAVFLMFNRNFPTIEHTECIFKGGSVCRYLISWEPSKASRMILAQRLSLCLLAGSVAAVAQLSSNPYLAILLLSSLPLHLGLSFLAHKADRKALLSSLDSMRNSSERLLAEAQVNYDTAHMMNQIGVALSRKTELDDLLSSVNQVLLKRLKFSRGLILLEDPARGALVIRSCFGFSAEEKARLQIVEHPLHGTGGKNALVRCFLQQSPLLASDLSEVQRLTMSENHALLSGLGVKSFICVPIVCEGESLGVLAVDDPQREGELLQSDLNIIQGVAPVIGIAVRNAVGLANERDLSEQLRKASELLERRVEARTAQLMRAQEELELLYDSVTHDLRTPLRVIYGYGELLLEGYGDCMDQTAKGYLQSMIDGGEQMEATLEKMLNYSSLKMMELSMAPVDLTALAERVLLDLRVTEPKRVVAATVQPDMVVCGDENLLKSVMENLLGNAWKYCAGKQVTEIEFGMAEGICYLKDNGAGFDMSSADRLFMPFQRLHGRDTFAGHGLGLAMVRRMLERMGGQIWAEGSPGEGATFYFTVSPTLSR